MAFIEEAIISGIISKLVNDGADITKKKIKEAVQNRNIKHQTFESQIYIVTVDALNEFTFDEYKREQETIYDVSEKLLIGFWVKGHEDIEAVRDALKSVCSYVDTNKCKEFLGLLRHQVSQEKYFDLYKEVLLLLQRKDFEYNRDELQQIKDELERVIQLLKQENVVNNQFENDKKEDYLKIWNSRLFLHRDKNLKPITLANAFIMPDFKIYRFIEGIGFANNDTLDQIIEKFIEYDRTSTMLIKGVPGMGKSSLTSWIAKEYIDDNSVILLRFRDFKRKELEEGLLSAICNKLRCENEDLENKILVLDGFDEIKALDKRDGVLNEYVNDLKDFNNFKCVITSRPAYINTYFFQNVVEIKQFDIGRVEDFYKKIKETTLKNKEKIQSNLEVLGIPVVLYMAIMSDIDISINPTKPELYNRIFDVKGGIFDKFFDGGTQYGSGDQILRDSKNIKKYLDFLSDTAFKMFEKDELILKKDECMNIKLKFKKEEISILEFPIKHLFESTKFNIEFIHKSIYEYFVSEYIFWKINDKMDRPTNELAGSFGYLLKKNRLSKEIIEFLKHRIINSKLKDSFNVIDMAFQLMLQHGMTSYTGKCYENIINCELMVFANMLEFIHIWEEKIDLSNVNYIKYNLDLKLNLRGLGLSKRNLRGVDLRKADLREANLTNAILRRVDLRGADLRGADLRGADLSGSDIRKALLINTNLENITLKGTIMDESQIGWLKKIYNFKESKLRDVKVCVDKTKKILNYEEFCYRE